MMIDTGVKDIEISKATSLATLYLENIPIDKLNTGNLSELTSINITNAGIKEIDISSMHKLEYLVLHNTQINGLDLKNNPSLRLVDTSGSPLAYLNIYSNIKPRYTKDTTLTLDVSGASFRITDYLKDIDLSKVNDLKGAIIVGNEFRDYKPGTDITYRYAVDNGNYINVTLDLQIQKEKPVITLNNSTKVYDGSSFVPEIAIDKDLVSSIGYKDINGNNLAEAPVDAGEYKLIVSTLENDLYLNSYQTFDFVIEKADPAIHIPGRLTYAYDGTAHPIEATAISGGGITYEYCKLDSDLKWNTIGERPSDAGIYKVIASVSGTNNYRSSSTSRIYMITKGDPNTHMASLISDKTYDGRSVDDPKIDHGESEGLTFIGWYIKQDNKWLEVDEARDTGEYAVVLFVLSDKNHYGDIEYDTFKITKAENYWVKTLTYDNGKPDAEAAFGKVRYEYSLKEDGTYTDEVPSSSIFYIKAIVDPTENYSGLTMVIKVDENTAISEDVTPPTARPDKDKDLPQSDEECATRFGEDFIYSEHYGACIIRYLIPDTKASR